jgi:hypothetical protein
MSKLPPTLKESAKELSSWPSSSTKKGLDDSLWSRGRSDPWAKMPYLTLRRIAMQSIVIQEADVDVSSMRVRWTDSVKEAVLGM